MLKRIKQELSANSGQLVSVLESFGFANIIVHSNYISFGRDAQSSKKSIVISLNNNDWLYVNDYAKNINEELFSYICHEKCITFVTMINQIKSVMGLTDDYFYSNESKGIFGGFYENIRVRKVTNPKIYDYTQTSKYPRIPNRKFLDDNISLEAQKFFDIRYDIDSQCIVIPILDQLGSLMAIKARCNFDVADGEQKYWYLLPGQMSKTLYGYAQNYEYLVHNTVILFESEKSVMQCYSYGIRNAVSLGSGTISQYQVQMLLELNPKKIILLHDVGYGQDSIQHNVDMIRNYSRFNDIPVYYWHWDKSKFANKSKASPSDLGKEALNYIIKHEVLEDTYGEDL